MGACNCLPADMGGYKSRHGNGGGFAGAVKASYGATTSWWKGGGAPGSSTGWGGRRYYYGSGGGSRSGKGTHSSGGSRRSGGGGGGGAGANAHFCPACGAAFTLRTDLSSHIRRSHGKLSKKNMAKLKDQQQKKEDKEKRRAAAAAGRAPGSHKKAANTRGSGETDPLIEPRFTSEWDPDDWNEVYAGRDPETRRQRLRDEYYDKKMARDKKKSSRWHQAKQKAGGINIKKSFMSSMERGLNSLEKKGKSVRTSRPGKKKHNKAYD